MVLVHGSSSSGAQWRLSDRLKDLFRVVAVDLLGCGGSTPWIEDEPLRDENEPDVLRTVIAHVGAPVHLIGRRHSYGGLMALKLAVSDQSLLRSLALIKT